MDPNTGVLSKADDAGQATNVRDLTIAGLNVSSLGLNDKFELGNDIKQDGDNAKATVSMIDVRGNKQDLIVTKGTAKGTLKFEVSNFKIKDSNEFEATTGDSTVGLDLAVMGGNTLDNAVRAAIETMESAARSKLKKNIY